MTSLSDFLIVCGTELNILWWRSRTSMWASIVMSRCARSCSPIRQDHDACTDNRSLPFRRCALRDSDLSFVAILRIQFTEKRYGLGLKDRRAISVLEKDFAPKPYRKGVATHYEPSCTSALAIAGVHVAPRAQLHLTRDLSQIAHILSFSMEGSVWWSLRVITSRRRWWY